MKKKALLTTIVPLFAVTAILFTSCGIGKEPITAQEFKTTMEDKGFTVNDATKQASDDTYQYIYTAADQKKYSFEYYFMTSDNNADTVYQYAVKNLNKNYKNNSAAKITEKKNGVVNKYVVKANDYDVTVSQNDNAVLYVTSYPKYQKDAEKIISDLGY